MRLRKYKKLNPNKPKKLPRYPTVRLQFCDLEAKEHFLRFFDQGGAEHCMNPEIYCYELDSETNTKVIRIIPNPEASNYEIPF